MGDILAGMFTLNYVVSNLAWTILLMVITKAWEWARGKPIEAKRKGWFWVFSSIAVFLLISILTYAVRGPSSPDLRGGIDQITVSALPDKPNSVGILLVFHVRNVGTPSIVENYQLTVTPAGWTTDLHGTSMFIPKVLSMPPSPATPQAFIVPFVCGKEALYRKTSEQPLIYGTQQRGYLWFEISGISAESLKNAAGTKFHMTFDDVLGKTYTTEVSLPAVSLPGGYYPGIGVPSSQNPDEACN